MLDKRPIARYARVSKKEQSTDADALERQLFQLERACTLLGDDPPDDDYLFVDIQSGRDDDRPEFEKLQQAVKSKRVRAVIIMRVDRIARNIATNQRLQKLFEQTGVELHVIAKGRALNWQDIGDWDYFVNQGVQAEREVRELSARTKAGMEYLRYRNKYVGGKTPFGYRRSPENTLEPNPEEWPLARRAVELFLQVRSPVILSRQMATEHGVIRNYQAWRRWLRSPVPRGHLGYKQNRTDGAVRSFAEIRWNTHEALITPEEAREIDAIIEEGGRIRGRNRGFKVYPLSGLMECAACGAVMHITSYAKRGQPNVYCSNRRKGLGVGCGTDRPNRSTPGIRYQSVEDAVIEALCQRAAAIARATVEGVQDEAIPEEDLKLQAQIESIEKLIKEIGDQSGLLKQKIAELRSQASQKIAPPSTKAEDEALLTRQGTDPDFWKELSPLERATVFKRLVDRVLIRYGVVERVVLRV